MGVTSKSIFKVEMDPKDAKAIVSGELPMPNPLDPASLPTGSKLITRSENFTNSEFGATFRGIGLDTGHKTAEGTGFAVEKLDENTVRISSGPFDRVNQSVGLGVSFGAGEKKVGVGAGVDKMFLDAKTKSVELDISTPEGKEAYKNFIETGEMPKEGPGVDKYMSVRTIKSHHELGAKLDLGPISFEGKLAQGAQLREVEDATGKRYELLSGPEGAKSKTTWRVGENGETTLDKSSIPVDSNLPSMLRSVGIDAGPNARLELNAEGANAVKDATISHLRTRLLQNQRMLGSQELRELAGNKALSNTEFMEKFQAALPENYYDRSNAIPSQLISPLTIDIASAKNPTEVALALGSNRYAGNFNQPGYILTQVAVNNRGLFSHPGVQVVN
ncbi:MAG TPA: hypothetical protein DCE42_26135 [Myxococcales bacterium]|nr:hypothetical protein [Myxococcales bacterium]